MRLTRRRSRKDEKAQNLKGAETPQLEAENPFALQDEIIARINKSEKSEKKLCKVIVATPTYFVIEKDGEKITIEENNNYKRNDGILY